MSKQLAADKLDLQERLDQVSHAIQLLTTARTCEPAYFLRQMTLHPTVFSRPSAGSDTILVTDECADVSNQGMCMGN